MKKILGYKSFYKGLNMDGFLGKDEVKEIDLYSENGIIIEFEKLKDGFEIEIKKLKHHFYFFFVGFFLYHFVAFPILNDAIAQKQNGLILIIVGVLLFFYLIFFGLHWIIISNVTGYIDKRSS